MFTLSVKNSLDYLNQRNLIDLSTKSLVNLDVIQAKNFNVLLTFSDGKKILVKQERLNPKEKIGGDFLGEKSIQEFWRNFPELEELNQFLPQLIDFDAENYIVVYNYLGSYQDLYQFYLKDKIFSTAIASSIGTTLGKIHRLTFQKQDYKIFLQQRESDSQLHPVFHLINKLERIPPEIFGMIPKDGLKFFALYQRFDSLGKAIAELGDSYCACCLTHNDLKLNNIILDKNWKNKPDNLVKFIDWERLRWGDPAFDLGMLIGNYIQMWLSSLMISKSLSIEESLRLATIPLETLQPSIGTLMLAYLKTFPDILQTRPDFLKQVVQFTGFALIQQIQVMLQYQKTFNNSGIATLQVAKSLLCRPETSLPTVFGATFTQFSPLSV
ncbi:aminoglycoside phosphotransferase [Gloeothece citriformis PCC 7424]|uniref:Aminoglycoside phosphotransferase n=1 Tax=Gloeothece citriformis (strain PCC 7424) TaxID=65393 RepID=B7KC67_GLOC7|nr:phosphotransferase [Gloeothece citriformis]ACK68890.1 aminoglycoside phosphotransferase [Gloeothece citriformis PCC 7424]